MARQSNKPVRWRLTWYLAATPDKTRSQWYSHRCKLCAAKRAYELGCISADLLRVPRTNVRWTIARVRAHMTEPEIVGNYSSMGETLLRRHAH